jgi:hypothetical protein
MATYLTLAKYKDLTTIPSEFVDEVESRYPGWVAAQLEYWARWIDARLRKRYATPFAAHDATPPTPPTVQGWLARIVNLQVWIKRGIDPSDATFPTLKEDHDNARAEVLETANANETTSPGAWFDLPLRADEDGTGISRGGPRSYSEQSPYVWTDRQRDTANDEDANGGGSYG